MRLDEYRRVSQVNGREGEGFQSPELQSKSIAAYASVHGHTVTPNPVELDVSGGKLKRPILDKIIARIRNGESDGIIVNDLDRYSRGRTALLDRPAAAERQVQRPILSGIRARPSEQGCPRDGRAFASLAFASLAFVLA